MALGFRHTLYEPERCFVDELFHGPFSRFVHVHEFADAESGTLIRDRLDIRLRSYYGGEYLTQRVVGPAVSAAFRLRGDTIRRLDREGLIAG